MKRFSEQFQLQDLDQNAVSDLTGEWLFDRQKNGFDDFSLHGVSINPSSLLLTFTAHPTYVTGATVPNISVNGSEVNKREYVSQINFINPVEFLGSPEDFKQFSEREQKQLITDYIHEGMAQVHCTCPAYYYQAHWEGMASHDSDIYPFPGPKGSGQWRDKHSHGLTDNDITICKHLASVIEQIDIHIGDIISEMSRSDWSGTSAEVKTVAATPSARKPIEKPVETETPEEEEFEVEPTEVDNPTSGVEAVEDAVEEEVDAEEDETPDEEL